MNALEFYELTNNSVEALANFTGVGAENLEKYYTLTDFLLREISSLSGVPQAFAQFTLHAQNATMISSIINFFKNYDFLKEKLKDFEPAAFLRTYHFTNEDDRESSVNEIVEALRYNSVTNRAGLVWKTDKSKNKDFLIKRFANSLIDGAKYFRQFSTREAIVNDLRLHYPGNDFRVLVRYLKGVFGHGFSVALCCDFLKEFDTSFDLAKPDVHLMEVIAKYKGHPLDYYKYGDRRAFECLDDFLELVREIKVVDHTLTAYKLDRQIWLCCSGNFFLDEPKNPKQLYLSEIL